jgi:hypothetical protein
LPTNVIEFVIVSGDNDEHPYKQESLRVMIDVGIVHDENDEHLRK